MAKIDPVVRRRIASALLAVDERQRKADERAGRHHNIYAIGLYLGALEGVERDVAEGKDLRQALVDHFHGRLLDAVLKAASLPRASDAECRGTLPF